jgi:hypothetical protein
LTAQLFVGAGSAATGTSISALSAVRSNGLILARMLRAGATLLM